MLTVEQAREICRALQPVQTELRQRLKTADLTTAAQLRTQMYANRREDQGLAAANRVLHGTRQETTVVKWMHM